MSQFADEVLARITLSNIIGRRVNWDSRRSRPAQGQYWACCPFHQEKTPSFSVNNEKGTYYCFGCQEKGNAITFLRKMENLNYREALQVLAESVGMEIPTSAWRDAKEVESRKTLYELCEETAEYYVGRLNSHDGLAARQYLAERGVSESAIKRFEIGFAPNGKGGITQRLMSKGVSVNLIQEAGICAIPEGGGAPYDRFWNRIMFPIRDARGRMIGFGGRSLDPNARAKYLNSPETPIFKKGDCLFNHHSARETVKNDSFVVVVEGYMDVISLCEAGINSCVAPLGTAVTVNQIGKLWQLTPIPVLALDGDKAGHNAAERVAERILPMLQPGKSLQFCFLPDNMDPDDFVRSHGGTAMRELIGRSQSLADFIWDTEVGKHSFATPEGRAAFEASMLGAPSIIRDVGVRRQYRRYFREQLFSPRSAASPRKNSSVKAKGISGPSAELLSSTIVSSSGEIVRERVILGICLAVPEVAWRFLDRLQYLTLTSETHQELLESVIDNLSEKVIDPVEFRKKIVAECGQSTVSQLLHSPYLLPLRRIWPEVPAGDEGVILDCAETLLKEELEKIEASIAVESERQEALIDLKDGDDGDSMARFGIAVRTRDDAHRGIQPEDTRGQIVADNGVVVDRKELEYFQKLLQSCLD